MGVEDFLDPLEERENKEKIRENYNNVIINKINTEQMQEECKEAQSKMNDEWMTRGNNQRKRRDQRGLSPPMTRRKSDESLKKINGEFDEMEKEKLINLLIKEDAE